MTMATAGQLSLFDCKNFNPSNDNPSNDGSYEFFVKASRTRPDGIHQRDVFHLWMLRGADFSPDWDMPVMERVDAIPSRLWPFSEVMRRGSVARGGFVHFFEDDYQFERVWNAPRRYLRRLRRFDGVIMPDFSICPDFPIPMRMWNSYRSRVLGSWFQRQGIPCIPNAHFAPGCEWMLEGLPRGGTIAVCGRGNIRDVENRRRFIRDLRVIVDDLLPGSIVYYGADAYGVLDYPRAVDVPVFVYEPAGRGRLEFGGRLQGLGVNNLG